MIRRLIVVMNRTDVCSDWRLSNLCSRRTSKVKVCCISSVDGTLVIAGKLTLVLLIIFQ